MLGFAVNTAQAQAAVIRELEPTYKILWTDYKTYDVVDFQIVVTPSGNINITATYQLDLLDPLVPEKGVAKYWATEGQYYHNDLIWSQAGGPWYFIDDEMIVTSKGKAKLVYHLNPANPPFVP
jgi:hypothetical protein